MDDNLIVRILMSVMIILIIFIIDNIVTSDKIKRKKYIIGIIIFVCIWSIFFTVDFIRAKNQKAPIFCPFTFGSYVTSGSVMHYGLGYKVIEFHQIIPYEERIDIKYGSANYYYICSWYPSFSNAWEKIKNEAIEYSYDNYLKNKELK